jgi:hypothetical protein
MKTEHEREQLIEAIHVLLNQSYDSTLDEIFAKLKQIESDENEADIKAYDNAMKDNENNISIPWDEAKKELQIEMRKELA